MSGQLQQTVNMPILFSFQHFFFPLAENRRRVVWLEAVSSKNTLVAKNGPHFSPTFLQVVFTHISSTGSAFLTFFFFLSIDTNI